MESAMARLTDRGRLDRDELALMGSGAQSPKLKIERTHVCQVLCSSECVMEFAAFH
eukprot:m.179669 g.179669  ORF g.179669 m.179669 type:complete len:56 (-) comp14644_c0_seq1:706-873(-)